jgi:putative endonuclease
VSSPRKNTRAAGNRGEDAAAAYLEQRGWEIVARNWRAGKLGEIDIVALDGRTLAIVEVKTAGGSGFGDPMSWVTPRKQAQIARVAEVFLSEYEGRYAQVRFDVAAVDATVHPPRVELMEDAWRMG